MPRQLTRASQVYPAGTYGPFSIDSFTRNDADGIEVLATVESWPAVPVVAVITVELADGSSLNVNVPGAPKNRDGTPATVFRCAIGIPADGIVGQAATKRDVRSAQASVVVNSTFRTALTVRPYTAG